MGELAGDVAGREPSAGSGLLVLGMHRSGTSALARVLALCGADLGARVSGAGAGNETGHWEDATSVEINERLLEAFGARWDDPFALPAGWERTEAGRRAAAEVAAYVATDRARQALWAAKDPRLCLAGGPWRDAMQSVGQRPAAVVLLRHPLEVAHSLLSRDGIALERGLLLWYDYTLSALEIAAGLPAVLVSFPQLLEDWRAVIARIRTLPGAQALDPARAAAAVEAFLEPARRHQRASGDQAPAGEVGEAWRRLASALQDGEPPRAVFDALSPEWRRVRSRWHPLAAEWRVERRRLWERVGRAEALLAGDASLLPPRFAALEAALEQHRTELTAAVSSDLRRMQAEVAEAHAAAALLEERRRVAEAGRLAEHARAQELHEATQAAAREAQQLRDAVASAREEAASLAAHAQRQAELSGAALEAAQGESTRLRVELDRAVGESERLRIELDHVVGESGQLRDALQQARADATRLHAELDQARAHATERSHALDVATERAAAAEHEVAQLQAALGQAHAKSWEQDALLQRIVHSRSWRLTRPLRAAMRWVRGEWQADDGAKLRRALWPARKAAPRPVASVPEPMAVDPANVVDASAPEAPNGLSPARPGLPDVFVCAVIDWRFRVQRPQHLARALAARGHRVFYLSNEFVDAPAPGFRVDPLDPALPLFQLHLHVPGAPAIYHAMPGRMQLDALRAGLAAVLAWTGTRQSICIVQHPHWAPLARSLPAARVVYDCMDHHGGFENNANDILDAEARLVADADLVIVTSEWLERELAPRARAIETIRNAGEFTHFSTRPRRVFRDERGRRVIGYYGAIAEWFDAGLVRAVARAHPQDVVVLVGSDTAGVGAALADLANVRMVGEVPYADLPYWLHGFDACLLPFKVIPLTLATNPVKVYEYLAAGKPVVCVDLPEMAQFGDCVRVASDPDDYARAVSEALREADDAPAAARRRAFAAGQTWDHRAQALDLALDTLDTPTVSVVVLTYNNLALTQACLASIEAHSDYRNLEVIVVDNASTDGSGEWLQGWANEPSAAGHARRLVRNDANLGFAAGNNVGLALASGEVLVLLNNDTYVTPGWVRGLANHLRSDPRLGLVGPVTNNIGNEARIEINYADMAQMIERAGVHTRAHPGMRLPLATVAFFCVAMRREVYERVGGLDERFGMGFFEDDDYCRRVHQAGYGIACAEDVFVHHHLSASFDALKAGQKQALFERNKALYEEKWGTWTPHAYRPVP